MVHRKWQTVAHGETDIAEGTWAWDSEMIHQLAQGIKGMARNRVGRGFAKGIRWQLGAEIKGGYWLVSCELIEADDV
jgi:hypothetical protein